MTQILCMLVYYECLDYVFMYALNLELLFLFLPTLTMSHALK